MLCNIGDQEVDVSRVVVLFLLPPIYGTPGETFEVEYMHRLQDSDAVDRYCLSLAIELLVDGPRFQDVQIIAPTIRSVVPSPPRSRFHSKCAASL
jgi:hypothetical protein